jgi:hypothetical protein
MVQDIVTVLDGISMGIRLFHKFAVAVISIASGIRIGIHKGYPPAQTVIGRHYDTALWIRHAQKITCRIAGIGDPKDPTFESLF